jgi:hypothetical protein
MSAQVNPYAPPKAHVADVAAPASEAEATRQEHVKHEAAVRSIGILYYIGGGMMAVAAAVILAGVNVTELAALGLAFGIGYLVLGALSIAVGRGVRLLQPWARTTSIVLAAIGLLGFPIGTLINAYILYLLLSAKGKRIFEPDYRDIVAATPHVKYRTSIVVWIVLGVLVIAMAWIAAVIFIPFAAP